MKLIVVKCPKNKKIQVEDRGTGGAVCPANCPLKQSSRCFNKTFRYMITLPPSVVPDIPYVAETEESSLAHRVQSTLGTESTKTADVTWSADCKKNGAPDTVVMDDLFSGSNDSVIGYDDPFATVDSNSVANDVSQENAAANSNAANILDKYNDFLVADNSIFAMISSKREDEPCFVDGAFEFYERTPVGVQSAGNAKSALRYIFSHWYVSRVFKENGRKFCEDFLYLLKLRGFRDKEEELAKITDDVTLSPDKKFFRLFYSVIYKNQISGFYWNEGDSPFRNITPMFLSADDFYKKLIASKDPTGFMSAIEPCFDELVFFLRHGEGYEGAREWFKKTLPMYVAEKQRTITYISERGGKMSIVNLGDIRTFVQNMVYAEAEVQMQTKVEFLKQFSLTENYTILPRTTPFEIAKINSKVDDGVYEIVGIFKHTSSRCATAFSYYTTLLREYMNTFKPESLTIGNRRFTMRNFYYELADVVREAGAYITVKNSEVYDGVKLFHAVKGLFAAGVFEYYESCCETSKLGVLKEAFVQRDTFDAKTYFLFKEIEHSVFVDGNTKTIGDYIFSITNGDAKFIIGSMGDKVVRAYLDANIETGTLQSVVERIDKLISKQKSLTEKF